MKRGRKIPAWYTVAAFVALFGRAAMGGPTLPSADDSMRALKRTIEDRVERLRTAPAQQVSFEDNFRWSQANWTGLRTLLGELTEELYGEKLRTRPGYVGGSLIRLDGKKFADGFIAEVLPDGKLLIREMLEVKTSISGYHPALAQVSENLKRLANGKTLTVGDTRFSMDQVVLAGRTGPVTVASLRADLPEVFASEPNFSGPKAAKEIESKFADGFVRILIPGTAGTSATDPRYPLLEQGQVTEQALAERLASHIERWMPRPAASREILATIRSAIAHSMSRRSAPLDSGNSDVAGFLAAPGEALVQFLNAEKSDQAKYFPTVRRGLGAMVQAQHPKLDAEAVDEAVAELLVKAWEFFDVNRNHPKIRYELPRFLAREALPRVARGELTATRPFDLRQHDRHEPRKDEWVFNLPLPDDQTREEFLAEWLEPILQGHVEPWAREALTMWMGLRGGDQATLDEIGQHFGIPTERARQLCARAFMGLENGIKRSGYLSNDAALWEAIMARRFSKRQ